MRSRLPLVLLAVVAVAVACGDDDGGDSAVDDPVETPVDVPPLSATVDWAARTVTIDGDTRFEVEFCEGEGPLLCVTDGGEHLGAVELLRFDAVADFDAWAAAFYSSMQADRIEGCDAGYVLDGADPVPAPFAGATGIRYGFTGSVAGEPVERVVGYAVNDGGSSVLLTANALADDACLAREGELPLEVMPDFEPVLAALAEGSRF